jgi:hypothetical protein
MNAIYSVTEFFSDAIDGRDGMDFVQLHDQVA